MRNLLLPVILLANMATAQIPAPMDGGRTYVVDTANARANDANAGTAQNPLKSIRQAATLARAGDVVVIQPGIYPDRVEVCNSGTPGKPIVFYSTQRHGAVVSAEFTEPGFDPNGRGGRVQYVTVTGLSFFQAEIGRSGGITASHGWCYQDCLIHGAVSGLCARGGDISVIRCVFEDIGENGLTFAWGTNWLVQDCITRRCNQNAISPGGYVGACKILNTVNARTEGLISYDNYGTGWWYDWDNRHFAIVGCTIFGNHAGEAHEGDRVLDHSWASAGIWTECNPSGLIESNVIYSCGGPGIGVLESSGLMIRHNLIVDCPAGIEFRAMGNRGSFALGREGAIVVAENTFKQISGAAIQTSLSDSIAQAPTPSAAHLEINGNLYDLPAGTPVLRWVNAEAGSLEEERTRFGIEKNGKSTAVTFPLPLIHVRPLKIAETASRDNLVQVKSVSLEALSIDAAISQAGAKAGDRVVIPVFGRKPLVENPDGWTAEVYDLQGRHIVLSLPSGELRESISRAIGPFARLSPVWLEVRLTKNEEYDRRARLLKIKSSGQSS